jgi:hypothetical protein
MVRSRHRPPENKGFISNFLVFGKQAHRSSKTTGLADSEDAKNAASLLRRVTVAKKTLNLAPASLVGVTRMLVNE